MVGIINETRIIARAQFNISISKRIVVLFWAVVTVVTVEVAAGPREASEVARVESPSWALSNKRPELGGNGGFAAGRHIRWRCEVAGNVLRMHRFSLIMIVAGDR